MDKLLTPGGPTMDASTIALLISTFGPILIPLASAFGAWLFHQTIGRLSPGVQGVLNPFLPAVAGALGTVLGLVSGQGALPGLVGGLAGTGLHQLVKQPIKAATKK